jgi:hypothetical protein
MTLIPIALPQGSDPARWAQLGAQRLVNCYAEQTGPAGKAASGYAIVAADGLTRLSTLSGSGGVRAMLHVSNDELLVVHGRQLSRVDQTGNATVVGGITSDGLVTMARNRNAVPDVMITADGTTWHYKAGVLEVLDDPDLAPAISVDHMDGYFVWAHPDGSFSWSSIDDIGVDALDFDTAGANPDGIVRNIARGREMVFFGEQSIEFWAQSGGNWSRITSRKVGCRAPRSVALVDQTVAFVADDGTVRILSGYDAQTISGQDLNDKIADEANPEVIAGYSWQDRGHTFYGLTGSTWAYVYDLTTGQWHERETHKATRWLVGSAHQFGNRNIFGAIDTSRLYVGSRDVHDEDGVVMPVTLQMAPLTAFPGRAIVESLHIDAVAGAGTGAGNAEDIAPSLMLDWADDGVNFAANRNLPYGPQGQTRQRIKAHRLGMVRDSGRTFRLRGTARTVRAFAAMAADITRLGP